MTAALLFEFSVLFEEEEEIIGRGKFGVVRRCVSKSTGEVFALKSVDKRLLLEPIDRLCAAREATIAKFASSDQEDSSEHEHVVGLRGFYEDDEFIHLVMDLCAGGDLLCFLSENAPLPENAAAELTAQLAEALLFIHRRGIAHRDIKPDNVLLSYCNQLERGGTERQNSHLVLKLADFGSAEWFGEGETMRGLVGTPFYVAPEVVAGRNYNEKVDVWSLGVILYMMLSGSLPFDGEDAVEVFDAVLRANLRFPPQFFAGVSPAAKDLLRKMLCRDPSRRLSAEQVLDHPWIKNGGSKRRLVKDHT